MINASNNDTQTIDQRAPDSGIGGHDQGIFNQLKAASFTATPDLFDQQHSGEAGQQDYNLLLASFDTNRAVQLLTPQVLSDADLENLGVMQLASQDGVLKLETLNSIVEKVGETSSAITQNELREEPSNALNNEISIVTDLTFFSTQPHQLINEDSFFYDEDDAFNGLTRISSVSSNGLSFQATEIVFRGYDRLRTQNSKLFFEDAYQEDNQEDNIVYNARPQIEPEALVANAAPVAIDDVAQLNEDGSIVLDLLANDSDAVGDALSISSVGNALHGVVALHDDGAVTYTPNANYNGPDSFTYTITDGEFSKTATVNLSVSAVNDAPSIVVAQFAIAEDAANGTVVGQVSASDIDGDALSYSITQGNPDGTFAINANGQIIIADNTHLDFETNQGHALQVSVTDGAATTTAKFNVTVGDVLETDTHDHSMGHDHSEHVTTNPHEAGSIKHGEHDALFDLVQHADATHFAVNNGSWFDHNTWSNHEIPGDNARVVIMDGVSLDYDSVSDARLFTVRVDGELNFATDADSKMVVDTFVVDPHGTLTIGTDDHPIQANVNVDIVIANNGPIDVSWDPQLLSRGVISHGTVKMHGEEKTTDLKVITDPMAGDTTLTLAEAPLNWHVGDTLVLAGTHYDGYKWDNAISATRHYEPEDEVLTITKIEGNVIHFDTPLVHDHHAPRADLKTSVANYTRNISIETENADTTTVSERGHVMFMHNDNIIVRYVEFHELGRTDKSGTSLNVAEYGDDLASDSNVKGRYSLHIHNAGVDDVQHPVMLEGNSIFGSPGWGIVQHDSNAIVHDNATYNTFGAGIVAETGNEIGIWSDNIVIYAQGVSWASPKNGNDRPNFDNGKTGSGYYFEGRMIEVVDNIAASANSGFTYFHRGRAETFAKVEYDSAGNKTITPIAEHEIQEGDEIIKLDGVIKYDASLFDFPEALGNTPLSNIDDAPILHFNGNETFASNVGFFVEKANPDQGHDIRTILEDFTAWEVRTGAHISYTSHYVLKNFDVVGKTPSTFSKAEKGIEVGTNASDVTIVDANVDGFKTGIDVSDKFTGGLDASLKQIFVVNANISNVEYEYNDYNPAALTVLDSDSIVVGRFEINFADTPFYHDGFLTYHEGYPDPNARRVDITGTKTDSLGTINLPAGTDNYDAGLAEVIRTLETDGYYSANGKNYFILEDYYSDRITGEVHKFGEIVEIDANVALGNQYFSYQNAIYKGEIDLNSAAPITANDSATTHVETDVIINLLVNDSDPDGDAIFVDGIVQPKHGNAYDNHDGTVTYRPDLEFTGIDTFKYWATDNFGNFTPSIVSVEVDGEHQHSDSMDMHSPALSEEGITVEVGLAGSGDDVLVGGASSDILYGDERADKFIFNVIEADHFDIIQDFNASEGDIIDISSLLDEYNEIDDALSDFVKVEVDSDGSSNLFVDQNGGGDSFEMIVKIFSEGGAIDIAELCDSGTILF